MSGLVTAPELSKRWRKRRCRRRYSSTGTRLADGRGRRDLAVLGLEDREQARLGGEPRDPDGVGRCASPAERARHEHVQVARAVEVHGPLDLGLEVVQVGDRGGRDVGDAVGHGERGQVLALAEGVARVRGPTASVVAVRAPAGVAPERWTPVFM